MKIYYLLFLFIICTAETCSLKKDEVKPILPIANFSYEIGNNGQVKFKNSTIGGQSYIWDFGNNKTSSDENPTHYYDTENEYIVTLRVQSKDKLTSEISKKLVIDNLDPVADFSIEKQDDGKIKIKNLSKFSNNFIWEIDGKTEQNNKTEFDYTFKENGKYQITLTAGKSNGISKKISKEIVIDNKEFIFLRCKGTITYSNFEKNDYEIELRSSDKINIRIPLDLSFLPVKEIKFKIVDNPTYILLTGNGQGIISNDKITFAYVPENGQIRFTGIVLK